MTKPLAAKTGQLAVQVISVPSWYRDNSWSLDIGKTQRKIDNLVGQSTHLRFDFTRCRWIDPLPALSLLIEIVRARHLGISVDVCFPPSDDGPASDSIGPYQFSPNKLLLFLAKEGFFRALIEHKVPATVGIDPLTEDIAIRCCSLVATASYADASFISMRLFDIPNADTDGDQHSAYAAITVSELLEGVESYLKARCSTTERQHLLYKLRAVLQEFLHNAQEHAYLSDIFRPAALYVRYRKGAVGLSSESEREFYNACTSAERKNCPKIGRDWLDSKRGCLEVFFLDRGQGISQTLPSKSDGNKEFETSMRRAFFDGTSSKEPRRKTENGGLHLLHNLLSRSNDHIRAIENYTWFGSAVPFIRTNEQVKILMRGGIPGEGLIGLGYQIRLSWKSHTEDGDRWLRFLPLEIDSLFANVLCQANHINDRIPEGSAIVDERFRSAGKIGKFDKDTRFLFWLPPRNMMKGDVLDRIESLASNISRKCLLIIADVPSIEAAVYQAAISNSKFSSDDLWPNNITAIVLATNRWSFAYAEYTPTTHGFTSLSTEEIPERVRLGLPKDSLKRSFRQLLVSWLKWHDSIFFWNEVDKSSRLFLAERVIWDEGTEGQPHMLINGYLDFPSATHNPICAALLRNALGRTLGLLGEQNVELKAVDSLADPIIHDVYAHEVYDLPSHGHNQATKFAVGSILVSGSTLMATGLSEKSIHFFVHGSSELSGKHASLFHWMPIKAVDTDVEPQKRIGKTSAIAPKGWLSIEIPRKHKAEDLNGARTPAETYNDWQSPGPIIVKAGHWCYEGHHDFLTINIPDAVDDAFARNGPLAHFLVNNVLHHLGVPARSIRKTYPHYSTPKKKELGILIYRSHPSSERIISTVLNTLEDSVRREVSKWIFPILPLRPRIGGSTLLIPPKMKQEIAQALKSRKRVMIFDDATISGRTIQDQLTAVKALGAENICILTIVNRLRLPAVTTTVRYFWQLDVPTIGRNGNCPLCQALDAAKTFAGRIVSSSEAHREMLRWISAWSEVSPLNRWDAGLDPLPLNARQIKHYCYKPDTGEYQANIPVFRSTGLMVHAAELHAMTTSDNYSLKKIKEQPDPAIKIGLAVSQLLLFGSELDQDLVRDLTIEGLLVPMARTPSNSPYGALAVLLIMRTLNSLSDAAQQKLIVAARNEIGALSSSRHGQILIAFFMSKKLIDWSDDVYYIGARLLSTRHCVIAEKLRSLFRETVSSAGNIHSEPIPRLIDSLSCATPSHTENQLWSALASIASLRDLVNELGNDIAAPYGGMTYGAKCESLKSALKGAEDELNLMLAEKGLHIETARAALMHVNDCLNTVADCYFHRIQPDEHIKGASFVTRVQELWTGTNIDWATLRERKKLPPGPGPDIRLSCDSGTRTDFGNAQWVWIPWTRQIQLILQDLLMNALYRHSPISDPWVPGMEGNADMWIRVRFDVQFVTISIANACMEKPSEIFQRIMQNSKEKTRWDVVADLGGSVTHDESLGNNRIAVFNVCLPYAPFMAAVNHK